MIAIRETQHEDQGLYDDGHLVEYAVSRPTSRARTPQPDAGAARPRGRGGPDEATVEATRIAVRDEAHTDGWLVGQFLATLLIGLSRHRRGERLAAIEFVHGLALRCLLVLIARHIPAEVPHTLDDLNRIAASSSRTRHSARSSMP